MFNKLVQNNFVVPEKIENSEFIIRKLSFRDAKLDYDAVMSSIDIIKKTRGGNWPSPDLSFEDDQIDLAWHQREFENRTSFAYTIMSPNETECLGCLYLYPPGYRSETSNDADVDVSFWVTKKAYENDFYPKVYKVLNEWLNNVWPFEKIVYTNEVLPS